MTSYTLTRVTAYLHCDVIGRISPTSVSSRTSDRGKSLLDTAPLQLKTLRSFVGNVHPHFSSERILKIA